MSRPIDLVLSRVPASAKLRPNGRGSYRSCCLACKSSNASTLSIAVNDQDSVLLKCWVGCTFSEVVAALGLEMRDMFPADPARGPQAPKPRMLTANQALDLLDVESTLVRMCATAMSRGELLDEQTRERLLSAAARVSAMRSEVNR